MTDVTAADQSTIDDFLSQHSDWRFEDDRLKADFSLADFDTAMEVVTEVAKVAREMDHHPLWTNVYKRLSFSLCTHRADDKVTSLDIEFATRIAAIVTAKSQ